MGVEREGVGGKLGRVGSRGIGKGGWAQQEGQCSRGRGTGEVG